jgi:proteasome lid subunit RPN8/RPN11
LNTLTIRLTESAFTAIERHALEANPEECCGLLSGTERLILNTHPLRNDADSPLTNYFASPEDLFKAMRRMREAGHEMVGIYHSHPRSRAYPSPTDVKMAFYPEAVYFIISLEPRIELRAFRIINSQVEEVEFAVVELA